MNNLSLLRMFLSFLTKSLIVAYAYVLIIKSSITWLSKIGTWYFKFINPLINQVRPNNLHNKILSIYIIKSGFKRMISRRWHFALDIATLSIKLCFLAYLTPQLVSRSILIRFLPKKLDIFVILYLNNILI